jgi:hypothetical protein
MQAYSNPSRESDPHALPDVEVFYLSESTVNIEPCYALRDFCREATVAHDELPYPNAEGWYYWYCFPGCMPDSGPIGPFATEAEALAAAQDGE